MSRAETIGFNGGGAFSQELRALGRRYASDPGRARRAQRRIYVKSAIIIGWAGASWALLMFVASGWWLGATLALSLGLALAGVGFNVTHDANHGSYSTRRWVNRSLRWSLDLIGASSYVWRVKHNIVHHTYTNISGADSDIEQLPFLRTVTPALMSTCTGCGDSAGPHLDRPPRASRSDYRRAPRLKLTRRRWTHAG